MSNIEISMKNASSHTTITVGEIFRQPRHGGPVVSDVNASAGRTSRCQLEPGAFTYAFHVEGDAAKFMLEIAGTGNPVPPTKNVDTSLGFSGWTFDFLVT